jgi:hypothetical protein
MADRDIRAIVDPVTLFAKVATTATQTIQGADISSYRGACFVVDVGTHTADDLVVTFQESDDNSTWTDIADADLEGSANDIAVVVGIEDSVIKVGYSGIKKYIGAVITDGGTGSAVIGVSLVKGFPRQVPAYSV